MNGASLRQLVRVVIPADDIFKLFSTLGPSVHSISQNLTQLLHAYELDIRDENPRVVPKIRKNSNAY